MLDAVVCFTWCQRCPEAETRREKPVVAVALLVPVYCLFPPKVLQDVFSPISAPNTSRPRWHLNRVRYARTPLPVPTYRVVGTRRRWNPRTRGCSGGEQLGLQPGAVSVPEEASPGAWPLELPPNLQGGSVLTVSLESRVNGTYERRFS